MKQRGHSLDILFPVMLLAVYVLAAAAVAVLAGQVYQRVETRSRTLAGSPAALSYVTERLRQSDEAGAVRVTELGGCPALVITQGDGPVYDTYIYCYDGSLRELMVRRELAPEPHMGRALLPLAEFLPEQSLGLLKLTCTDEAGTTARCWVSLLSGEVAK